MRLGRVRVAPADPSGSATSDVDGSGPAEAGDVLAVLVGPDTDLGEVTGSEVAVVLDVPGEGEDHLLRLLRDPAGLPAAVAAARTDRVVDLLESRVLAPLHRPGKIVAVGLNYLDHTAETGLAAPTSPLTFAKYPSSVTGPYDDIVVPHGVTAQVDYEAELAVVVGQRGQVAAYTVADDVSARDVQFADKQWTRGKSFDTFTPMGPWLVTTDEVPDATVLRIRTDVGGERRQDDLTGAMVFDIPTLLDHIGAGTTLEPGDVVLTGTPSGAGAFLDPPRFLADGDVVEIEIEGVGLLRNTVRTAAPAPAHEEATA